MKKVLRFGIPLLLVIVIVVAIGVSCSKKDNEDAIKSNAEMDSTTTTTTVQTDEPTTSETTEAEKTTTTTKDTEEETTTTAATAATTTKGLPEVIIPDITTRTIDTATTTTTVSTTTPTETTTTTTPTETTTTTTTTTITKIDPTNIEEVTKMSYGELQGIILSNFEYTYDMELWIVDGVYYLNNKVVVLSSTKNVGEELETVLGTGIVVGTWEQPGYVIVESDDVG